jgi:ribulose-phosphate 3-epimerase
VTVRINPSILAADFANLEQEIGRIASADLVHVDVMDNHFVPNLTFGQRMVESLQRVSPLPLDVHLMIDDPDRWAPGYAEAGAYSVTFHAEAAADAVALARRLRDIGARAGIAVKPDTPIEPYLELLPEFDQVLVMTVEPGFGGQSFIDSTMPKLVALRWTAASTSTRSASRRRPAPTPSSPGRVSSTAGTPPSRSPPCGPLRPATGADLPTSTPRIAAAARRLCLNW